MTNVFNPKHEATKEKGLLDASIFAFKCLRFFELDFIKFGELLSVIGEMSSNSICKLRAICSSASNCFFRSERVIIPI